MTDRPPLTKRALGNALAVLAIIGGVVTFAVGLVFLIVATLRNTTATIATDTIGSSAMLALFIGGALVWCGWRFYTDERSP